jgi:hypothetical protein
MVRKAAKLVSALQLARVGLVFTAVSNAWLVVLLSDAFHVGPRPAWDWMPLWAVLLCTAVAAAGLYVFGMTLNDVMDARHDRTFAPDRPIPSGRFGAGAAIAQAVLSLLLAVAASVPLGPTSTLLCLACATLILFYDTLGKHVTGVGIVTLGLIRAVNMLIANPSLAYCWPIWLTMSHVIGLSAACHKLEGKRPRLDHVQTWIVTGGWAFASVVLIAWVSRGNPVLTIPAPWFWVGPVATAALFGLISVWNVRRIGFGRAAGAKLMKDGLLWLIVYDTSWLLSAQLWPQATLVGAMLPLSLLSMSLMRSLKNAVADSPTFQRDK